MTRNGDRLQPAELIAYCQDKLAAFEIPAQIGFADKLPLTAKGAVDRSKAAETFATR